MVKSMPGFLIEKEAPGTFMLKVIVTFPDGRRSISVARTVSKPAPASEIFSEFKTWLMASAAVATSATVNETDMERR